jgi:DNA-binding IclR family transcriptional regulator
LAHQELAEMTGCSRETVSRALNTLKRKKCISWDERNVRLDMSVMQKLSGQFESTANLAYSLGSLGLG